MPYCHECGSKLLYDRSVRAYVCPSCGLTYTTQDLIVEASRGLEEKLQAEKKRRKYEEYLEWWTSKK
ncbi:MAG: transposase [Nitrososphaeria archaeon]|nr:transposase [Nitrososphaeria archaeon]